MEFELKLTKPNRSGAWIEGLVMGLSYLLGMCASSNKGHSMSTSRVYLLTTSIEIGGILPMIPYFAFKRTNYALVTSIGITVVILIIFGYGKSTVVGNPMRDSIVSACYTLLVGIVAAGTSYGIVRGIDSADPVRA